MKEYQRLHQLIISLNEKEVKYVSRRLKEHSSSKDDGLRILGLINKNAQIVSLEFIKHNTSLPANSDSLRKYLRRLYVRIIESLYLYIVEKEVEEFDQRSKKWDSVKRNLRFAEILFSHNNYQSAMELLDVVIKESQEYEYYDHLISALNRKLLKVVLRKESNYQELADQLEIASETQNYIAKSDLLLRSFNAITDPIQREKYQKKISIETVKIEQFLYKYNSVRLRINYIYLKLDSNQENVKYANRKSVLTALHTFLNKNSKKVKRNDFLMCYLNLAEMEFSNFNILQMSKYLTLAKKFLSDNSFNRFIVLELELKSALAVDDTKNLLALSEIFGRVDYTALSDHQRNKFIIYRALLTVYFGNSKSALHQLLTSAIKFDSVIDRFYNRIFEIQLMVENGKIDMAEKSIEALRKFLKSGIDTFSQRELLQFKVLQALEYNSFDFNKVSYLKSIMIDKLKYEYSWKPNSLELIIFEEWFESKLKGVPYHHKTAVDNVRRRLKAVVV